MESLGLALKDPAAYLFPSELDKQEAYNLLETKGISDKSPFVVFHPGSGGKGKIWPTACWENFCFSFLQRFSQIPVFWVGGESDILALDFLRYQLRSLPVTFLENLPLPVLAAVLSKAWVYVGHDTGISHVAAAAGAPCLLLYGPTDPKVWAPANRTVHVLTSPTSMMEDLTIEAVFDAFEYLVTTYAGNRNGFIHRSVSA